MKINPKIAALVIVTVVAAGAGTLAARWWSNADTQIAIAGFVYPQPRALSPVTLIGHDGTPFPLDRLRGKWSFVYFGYTYCPDVCPTTLAELARVHALLAQAGADRDTQYIFVSVDPKRDTPAQLAQYVAHFDKQFIGVTGTRAALDKLTQQVGVAYDYPEGTDGDNYPVSHSSIVALFDPDARLHAVFTAPHKAESIVDGFRRLRERWVRTAS